MRRLSLLVAIAAALLAAGLPAAPASASKLPTAPTCSSKTGQSGSLGVNLAPGTSAPPATLGGFPMSTFAPDPSADLAIVSSIGGPTGAVHFSPAVEHRIVPSSWLFWSNGYTGDVYYAADRTCLIITLPARTRAFYFYVEPEDFSTSYRVTATAQDGTTTGAFPLSGMGGARYIGFFRTGKAFISSITVSMPTSTNGFAVGEFGING
jgi:hypothetical protein